MKKIFLILLFLSFTQWVFAIDESCFQMSGKITWVKKETLKVITDDVNNYYFQDGKLLNTKTLSVYERKYFPYTDVRNQTSYTQWYFNFDQYEERKQILIKFDTTLWKNTFDYSFLTDNWNYHFEISKDGNTWHKIEDDIKSYDLDYLKISFDNDKLDPTTVNELSFYEYGDNELLLNSESDSPITVYNWYACSDEELIKLINKTKKTQYFPIDTSTKSIKVSISNNPNYNPNHVIAYMNRDSDNDGIIDVSDNCPSDYNPNQLDSTADGMWDMCSDKDHDWIKGNVDNCTTVSNPDQKDENKNWIWDVCEIDTDKDTIFDAVDNCTSITNEDQFDSDGDGIWDTCDNCSEIYNADQKDIDKDGIWDICDEKDNRYIESNKTFFTILILSIIAIFWVWIFAMVKKIKNMQK